MKPVIEKKAKSFEVRLSASDEYNAKVQRRMVGTVWDAVPVVVPERRQECRYLPRTDVCILVVGSRSAVGALHCQWGGTVGG